jgi:hypothetical protein
MKGEQLDLVDYSDYLRAKFSQDLLKLITDKKSVMKRVREDHRLNDLARKVILGENLVNSDY